MGRPRKHNTQLPECVYKRRELYYYVKKGKWEYLASSEEDVPGALAWLLKKPGKTADQLLEKHLRTSITMLRARPEARTGRLKAVEISTDYILDIARTSGWRCSVSGLKLSLQVVSGRKPYAPSIDRIDCARDYVPGNVRVVCVMANLAMNVWGEKPLRELARAMCLHFPKVLDSPIDPLDNATRKAAPVAVPQDR